MAGNIDYRPQFDKYKYPISPAYLANVRDVYYFPDYLSPRRYNYVSRYQETRQISDPIDNKIYHETFNNKKVKESSTDKYITVDNIKTNRLDIISAEQYKTPIYWWVLAMANNIIDPFSIPLGTVIRVPSLSVLYESGGVLEDVY